MLKGRLLFDWYSYVRVVMVNSMMPSCIIDTADKYCWWFLSDSIYFALVTSLKPLVDCFQVQNQHRHCHQPRSR